MINRFLSISLPLALFLAVGSAQAQPSKPPAAPPPVIVGQVVRQEIGELQSFVGSVSALRQVTVGSAVEGRVGDVFVNRGDKVAGPRELPAAEGEPAKEEPGASSGSIGNSYSQSSNRFRQDPVGLGQGHRS
jgi:hypothetical protein